MRLSDSIRSAYDRAVRSIVQIGGRRSFGTAFVVAPGLLATNNHVVRHSRFEARFHDGTKRLAYVVARSPSQDLALLECDTTENYPLTLAESRRLELGDVVFAIGNPLGISNAWSLGIVSGDDGSTDSLLQMDIDLAPGNSGGPVFNAHGAVVGIATMIVSPGIGLAVRSESIEQFLAQAAKLRAA